jgi:spermidine/putrescine transport system ATP-binding protein
VRDGSGEAAAVRLIGLTKRFGQFTAVDGIDLEIPAGSFFALLGPSGCGKTTTLRMIGGLEDPTDGSILLDDDDVTHAKPYKRPVNTVFQSYALFPHMSIAENVAFGLRRKKAKDIERRVDEMLELVQLDGYGKRRPSELSGGQQQRVALARALINHPKVLLLDEPLGALDLKLRRQMQLELKRIQTEVGITFVHVTHDQEEAMTMADTIAVMHDGQVEQLGGPVELYERPRTAFVANFLGQSNLLTGRIDAREGGGAVVRIGDRRLRVADAGDRPAGARVAVGIRPEKIDLAPAGGEVEERGNALRGVIEDSSFSGVSTQYVVAMPWGQRLTVFAQNRDLAAVHEPGTEVTITWEPRHGFCLDPDEVPVPVEGAAEDGPTVNEREEPETPGTVAGVVETEVQTQP